MKQSKKGKLLSLLLCFAMLLGMLPITAAFAEGTDLNEALNAPGGTLDFVSEGTYPWVVEEDHAKSTNEGIASSESTVSTTVMVNEGDIVQFDFTSGGEGTNPSYDWDNLKFKVDGIEVIHWALHNEWETYSQELEEGEHTLSWTYKKDSSVNPTPDFAQLDNVYVGAPVMPDEIKVEDLTVAGNRFVQLVWEVLPAVAFDKSVNFAIADETVATIDENGVVAGIAEGKTTVTVTSAAVPAVSGTATITVTAALPELTLDSVLNVEGGALHFVSEGEYPWVVPKTAPAGQECAKSSNEGVHSSSSTIAADFEANEGDVLRFDFQCWGEGSGATHWDKLELKVDGAAVIDWGEGPKEWTTYCTTLTAGAHHVEWTYSKDNSGHKEGDHALLDNVYVGQPPKPEEIQVEPVTVPAGRHAMTVYTVLPEDAFNKSVTFATENEDIATVDEDGVVIGVAEGTTNLIVTSVAAPAVSGTAVITVTEAQPTTWLNGYIADNPGGTSGIWGRFANYDPSVVENKGEMRTTFAGAFAGGKVYGFTHGEDAKSGEFYITDAETYETTYPGASTDKNVIAMAYNHADDTMYAIVLAADNISTAVYTVNLAVGSLEYVADIDADSEIIMTLAIAANGAAYGLTYADGSYGGDFSKLYSINLETGECTLIGSTGKKLRYVQSMTWDFASGKIYWAQYYDNAGDNGLCVVDPATGAVTEECGAIGGGAEITALWIKDDFETPPIVSPEFSVTFKDGVTGDEIPGGYTVEAGTVLNPEDFPAPPVHEGFEFENWDYAGQAICADTVITANYRDPNMIGFYFETDPALEGWSWEDSDGDGHNWQWISETVDPSSAGWRYPEGKGCMNSQSYINNVGQLTPDNLLISPAVPGGGSVSFKIIAQDAEEPEPVDVYAREVGTTDWGASLGHFVSTAEVVQHTVYLSQFAGKQIQIAFRHFDVTNKFSLNLDAVEVSPGEGYVPVPKYNIEAEGGTAAPVVAAAGTIITITANPAPDGMVFDKWEVVSGNVSLEDETSAATTFTMPEEDVHVKATYTEQSAGGLLGDVNLDGMVDAGDAVLVLRHDAQLIVLTGQGLANGDVNFDGVVDAGDAVLILRYDAKLITGF